MNLHHTKSKGDLAVLKAQIDLYEKGYWVATPLTENAPFDLMINKEGVSKTVQVKYVTAKDGVIKVSFRTSWSDKNGSHINYINKSLIDLYCVYCPDTNKCYYFDPKSFENENSLTLRIEQTKNKQSKNVIWADNFTSVV